MLRQFGIFSYQSEPFFFVCLVVGCVGAQRIGGFGFKVTDRQEDAYNKIQLCGARILDAST